MDLVDVGLWSRVSLRLGASGNEHICGPHPSPSFHRGLPRRRVPGGGEGRSYRPLLFGFPLRCPVVEGREGEPGVVPIPVVGFNFRRQQFDVVRPFGTVVQFRIQSRKTV